MHNHPVPNRSLSPPPSAAVAPPGVRFNGSGARIADFIDHTLLKAEATLAEVEKLCDEAREHRFAAVCVNPSWVRTCAQRLAGSGVQIATVVGFPLGATTSASKRREAEVAIEDGATEIDMVAAIGQIKSGDWHQVADDIAAVVAGARGHLVKVIIESAALTPVEVIKTCAIAREMGAHYVKTSTGFHAAGGATAEAVALMRLVVGDALGVKASGGVRDCETALRMIANGATRIGTSSGVSMARCLGPGPLPVTDLLSLAHGHAGACHTCVAGGSSPDSY
jgi:deoxyribose-phosphate aldolase